MAQTHLSSLQGRWALQSTIIALILFAAVIPQAQAQANYEQKRLFEVLTAFGNWELTAEYGWVWTPLNMPDNFRPYTNGRWVWTEHNGWMWNSKENWAWACYHYGRWIESPVYGWVWTPGDIWAPAWVAWKAEHGYIGWAPLPTGIQWSPRHGLNIDPEELDRKIPASSWVFVDQDNFLQDDLQPYVLPRTRNLLLAKDTANITRYAFENGQVVNLGVPAQELANLTRQTITTFGLNDVANAIESTMPSTSPDMINVFRPIKPTTPPATAPQPATAEAWQDVAQQQRPDYQYVEIEQLKDEYQDKLEDDQARREYETCLEWLRQQHEIEQDVLQRKQRCRLAPPPPMAPEP